VNTLGTQPERKAKLKQLDDNEIRTMAARWESLHRQPKTRSHMDTILLGLAPADRVRVVLCGQRIACGLTPKVHAATEQRKEEKKDANSTEKKSGRPHVAQPSTGKAKGKVSVGAGSVAPKAGGRRSNPKRQK
jgi:hypothetical protein